MLPHRMAGAAWLDSKLERWPHLEHMASEVDMDMAAYLRPPTTNTASLATGSPFHCTEKRRQITSDMAQPS